MTTNRKAAAQVEVIGHCVRTNDGDPTPECQQPGCIRRAQYMYRNSAGFKVYRPWCEVHRPIHGLDLGTRVSRPRPYAQLGQTWDESEKCPHCHRKREPRQPGGILRATCRLHRGLAPDGERRGQGRPRAAGAVDRSRPTIPRPRAVKAAARVAKPVLVPRPPVDPNAITFRDGSKSMSVVLSDKDMARLKVLHKRDVGHYAAATDSRLSRRMPTALIAALWYRLGRDEEK